MEGRATSQRMRVASRSWKSHIEWICPQTSRKEGSAGTLIFVHVDFYRNGRRNLCCFKPPHPRSLLEQWRGTSVTNSSKKTPKNTLMQTTAGKDVEPRGLPRRPDCRVPGSPQQHLAATHLSWGPASPAGGAHPGEQSAHVHKVHLCRRYWCTPLRSQKLDTTGNSHGGPPGGGVQDLAGSAQPRARTSCWAAPDSLRPVPPSEVRPDLLPSPFPSRDVQPAWPLEDFPCPLPPFIANKSTSNSVPASNKSPNDYLSTGEWTNKLAWSSSGAWLNTNKLLTHPIDESQNIRKSQTQKNI